MNYQNYQNLMLLTSSDTKRTLMHLLLFTNSAQRELVSICTQSIHNRNWLSLPYILGLDSYLWKIFFRSLKNWIWSRRLQLIHQNIDQFTNMIYFKYRVTRKGWDFRDDCTEFILSVSYVHDSLQMWNCVFLYQII